MANKFDNLVDDDIKVADGEMTSNVAHIPQQTFKVEDETYTEEEQRDVNAITVTIPDTQTPIVVFFGSPASGKTLALMRMVGFLEAHSRWNGHNQLYARQGS